MHSESNMGDRSMPPSSEMKNTDQDPVQAIEHVTDEPEKPEQPVHLGVSDRRPEARGKSSAEMPPSYFRSLRFWGSYFAIGLALACGTGGFALIAPVLDQINNSFENPSREIIWVGIVYTLMQSIVFVLAGRLSDIFGRRWFFIIGSVIGLIGSIIGATSHSVGQLIAGEVFIGIAAGFQISFFWVVSEIVPMNKRMLANSGMFIISLPTNTLGPKIALTIQNTTSVQWRGCFYLLIALNAASVLAWYLFYHPPTFTMLHEKQTARQLIKNFDYVGLVLFTAGMLLLLMGLNWGGSLYPWKSAQVLATIIIGAVLLTAFGLYESLMPLKEPYLPMELIKNIKFTSAALWASTGAMTFYAFGLIWPQAVGKLYPGMSMAESSTLAGLVTMSFVLGQTFGTFITNWVPPKIWLIGCTYVGTGILTAVAADPLNKSLTIGLLATGACCIGGGEGVAMAMTTFPLRNQEEIGTAGGIAGAIRLTGSSIAVAMYSTILANRLSVTVPSQVIPVMTDAGLSTSSMQTVVTTLLNNGPLDENTAPGLTNATVQLIESASRVASAQAYRTVFLSTLGFGAVALVVCWFTGGVDESQGDYVASKIFRADENTVLKEGGNEV